MKTKQATKAVKKLVSVMNLKALIEMDFCHGILHLTLLLSSQLTVGNTKALYINSHLLNSENGNREKFTIELPKSNFEEKGNIFDHPLKTKIAKRFRRALETAVPTKAKVTFNNFSVVNFSSSLL